MSDGGTTTEKVAAEAAEAPVDPPREEAAVSSAAGGAELATTAQPGSSNDPPAVENREPDIPAGPLNDEQKASVRRQVSFYFCDSNLVRDVFLKKKMSEDAEGYVSIALLMSFARMRNVLNIAKETGPDKIPEGMVKEVGEELRKCENIVVNEEATKVRRTEPLGSEEEVRKKILARSLCVSKFPPELALEDMEKFFGQHVEFNCVWMIRRGKDKTFKGEVFLDCKSVEVAKEFMEKKVEYDGTPLVVEWKAQAALHQEEEKRGGGRSRGGRRNEGRGRGRGWNQGRGGNRGGGRRGRGGRGGRGRHRRDDGGVDNGGNDDMQVDQGPQDQSAQDQGPQEKSNAGEEVAQNGTDKPVPSNGEAQGNSNGEAQGNSNGETQGNSNGEAQGKRKFFECVESFHEAKKAKPNTEGETANTNGEAKE